MAFLYQLTCVFKGENDSTTSAQIFATIQTRNLDKKIRNAALDLMNIHDESFLPCSSKCEIDVSLWL